MCPVKVVPEHATADSVPAANLGISAGNGHSVYRGCPVVSPRISSNCYVSKCNCSSWSAVGPGFVWVKGKPLLKYLGRSIWSWGGGGGGSGRKIFVQFCFLGVILEKNNFSHFSIHSLYNFSAWKSFFFVWFHREIFPLNFFPPSPPPHTHTRTLTQYTMILIALIIFPSFSLVSCFFFFSFAHISCFNQTIVGLQTRKIYSTSGVIVLANKL